jgi:hypothetical protein
MYCDPSIKTDCHVQGCGSSRTTTILYMSLLLEPDTADTESQIHEHDLQSLAWRNIDIDKNYIVALKEVIEEIAKSTDNLPDQIIEAANAVFKISSGINAIMISLCLLARITNSLLFSGYRTTRRISSGLWAVLQSWSSSFGSHTRHRSINQFGHLPSLEKLSIIL